MNHNGNEGAGPYTALAQGTTQKKGHKCCGGCCDTRRAVIIVDMVLIAILLLGTLPAIAILEKANPEDFNDDRVRNAIESFGWREIAVSFAIAVAFSIPPAVGVLGAIWYNEFMVGLCLVSYVVLFILDLSKLSFAGCVLHGFFAYPHAIFIKELRDGTMSKANYPVEEHSCCCV
jgi:hypothetical protein